MRVLVVVSRCARASVDKIAPTLLTIAALPQSALTPLANAAAHDHYDVVEYLVESGANVNATPAVRGSLPQ